VPTLIIEIYIIDIVKIVWDMGSDKIHKPGVAKCNRFKAETLK
jgi:hypothetical protein